MMCFSDAEPLTTSVVLGFPGWSGSSSSPPPHDARLRLSTVASVSTKYFRYFSINLSHVASIPDLTLSCYTKKAWNDFLSIFKEASPNAYQRNKQSTPTPYRISIPLVGEWIYDKHERS